MLFNVAITKWTDTRDSSHRVTALDGWNREFVLNAKCISDIVDISTATEPIKSRFLYSDNPTDRREGLSVIEALISPARLITLIDTSPASQAVTLGIHKNNNIDKEEIDTTILVDHVISVDRYNPSPLTHVWLVYTKGSYKRMEVLCGHGLEEFIDIIQTETTTPAQ